MAPVRPVCVAPDPVVGEVGHRHGAGLHEPALHETVHRDQGVARVAEADDALRAGGNGVIGQMALEAAGLGALGRLDVEAAGDRHLDPGDDAGDVVEVHVAAGAQGMEDLLQPGCAAFAEG